MADIAIVWVDYEQVEVFTSKKEAMEWCRMEYGPDRQAWPVIEVRSPQKVRRSRLHEYTAIAWWPDWTYEAPPKRPFVESNYQFSEIYVDSRTGSYRFMAKGKTLASAEANARRMAMQSVPLYVGGTSSMTTSGMLKVFRREDFRGIVGEWS